MKFSIITVTYNCINTIEKTIASVLEQSYMDYEYIIIDGCSTDGTCELIDCYKEYLSYYISEPDGGIYDAMNKGLEVAQGEYVHFLNAGDRLVDNVLGRIALYISKSPADVVFGDVYAGNKGNYKLESSQLECIDWRMNICHQAIFMKKTRRRFDNRYEIAADYELVNRMYNEGCTFQYIPISVAFFENGGKSSEWYKTRVEFARIACTAQIRYGRNSAISRDIIVDGFMDTISKLLFIDGKIYDEVVLFLKKYLTNSNKAVVWGGGKVAKEMIPAIMDAGFVVTAIIDRSPEKKSLNGIPVVGPSKESIGTNTTLFILTEKYCDEIFDQLKDLRIEESVQIVKFTEATREYINIHREELLAYMRERYDFFNEMMEMSV